MKRPYLLAAGVVAVVASAACHRNDCPSTTSTTSATVNPSDPGLQTPRPAPNSNPATASPAVPPATAPAITPADLPSASGTAATARASQGSAATAAPPPRATATGPVDITGPSPTPDTNATSTGAANATGAAGAANATGAAAPGTGGAAPGNANAVSTTTTTGAPLVSPGLDNGVTGGVANTGAPLNPGGYSGYAPAPYTPAPTSTMAQPVGGAMRPGAASDPNTTSGR